MIVSFCSVVHRLRRTSPVSSSTCRYSLDISLSPSLCLSLSAYADCPVETGCSSSPSREFRAIALRCVALAVLSANLLLGASNGAVGTYTLVISGYVAVGIVSLTTVALQNRHPWLRSAFALSDAILVAAVLYPHILGNPVSHNHNLTTTALVVAFILLNHVGLKKDRRQVLLFSCASVAFWIGMLIINALRHAATGGSSFLDAFLTQDLGLAISFAFTAFANYLLAKDHERTRRAAFRADMRRANLSRFFSHNVPSDLQEGGSALELKRREAAVMFVDLRGFTSFAETAPSHQLAQLLTQYRALVSDIVFDHGGTIDKYIGDGVMAVFGHPTSAEDDADRALLCSIELVQALHIWKSSSLQVGLPGLAAGIGLHFGPVIAGVLDSGRHLELTVVGDTVNVAQRLESFAKPLSASLVVSAALMARLKQPIPILQWQTRVAVPVRGRRIPVDIWYLRQPSNDLESQWRGPQPDKHAVSNYATD